MDKKNILITGVSGFIGHHLANHLSAQGHYVKGVDIKPLEYGTNLNEFRLVDLRRSLDALMVCNAVKGQPLDEVYHLAADMGGIGYISPTGNQYSIRRNNSLINLNMIEAARKCNVKKFLFSSSACIYPEYKQGKDNISPLMESDAYPAQPQDSYGSEKLFSEELLLESGLDCRIVRFHNIYGPEGTYDGGKEKSPAALCRKVAAAKLHNEPFISIWGDGTQTRSYCYIDDCVTGLELIMRGFYSWPVNLGRDEMVSIRQLADLICSIAKISPDYNYIAGPIGVLSRNSDNSLFRGLYNWEPKITLEKGLKSTYKWVEQQIVQKTK